MELEVESEDESEGAPRFGSLEISAAILAAIAELDEFKGAWRALGRIAPDRLVSLRRVATIESIGSSTRIEGARLSDRDVERLLANLEIRRFDTRDEQEVAGYAAVMETVFTSARDLPLSENHVRQLHRDLLQLSEKDARHRGEYKKLPNHVEAFDADGERIGIVFETATPFETPRRMTALVDWTRAALAAGELHPLLVIGVFVVDFLAIHPFQEGNGRLSRILTTLLLLRAGYEYVPYASLESVVEERKDDYYLALRRTQQTLRSEQPDWQPWIQFFLDALLEQKRRLERRLEREQIVLGSLPELSMQLLETCRERGRITVAEATRLTGANRNTIKDHLRRLTKAGQLVRHGAGRGTWYGLG
jgi:Fic family protein